jgi:glycosyltransferase involved in cell wall biosynthesis
MARELKVDQKILMTGGLAEDKYDQAFSDADIVVVPSDYEGVPTVLLQAMSYGKPTVATQVGGISRVIKDSHNGILVENSSSAVKSGVMRLLEDRQLSRHVGRNAAISVKRFLWSKIAEQIEALYYETLEPTR